MEAVLFQYVPDLLWEGNHQCVCCLKALCWLNLCTQFDLLEFPPLCQAFPTWALLTFGPDHSLLWQLSVHHRTFGSNPGLYLPYASSAPPPSHDIQKCLQMMPNVPWEEGRITPCLSSDHHSKLKRKFFLIKASKGRDHLETIQEFSQHLQPGPLLHHHPCPRGILTGPAYWNLETQILKRL